MKTDINLLKSRLSEKGLKITPQRIYTLDAIYSLDNHPTAEMIMEYVSNTYPGIATGTIYKILDVFVSKNLIKRVKTEKDIMRYDGIIENHHHLYSLETGRIENYENEELDRFLTGYFRKNRIRNFEIQEIKLQINGRFLVSGKKNI